MAAKKTDAPAAVPPHAEMRNGYLRVKSPNRCSVLVTANDEWAELVASKNGGPRIIKGTIQVRDDVTNGIAAVPVMMKVEFERRAE